MPRISRLFIKTGMIFFLLGVVLRLLLDVFGLLPAFILRPLFWHAIALGWITQIIMGVSTWMFPGRTKEEGFKAQKLPWLTYLFLNSGLILRFISSPLVELYRRKPLWHVVLAFSAVLLLAAVVCFVMELWPRILSKQQQIKLRKKRREKRKKNKKA